MGTKNLHRLFNPKSLAIVGITQTPGNVGFSIMNNLLKTGYKGTIFPVCTEQGHIMGMPCFNDIEKIGSPIDMAVITSRIEDIPDIVESCGRSGVAGIAIISSGGRKTGEKGRTLEADILKKSKKYNIRILGPNCMGIVNTAIALNASFASVSPLPGKIAFISQSSAVCTSILDLANREKIGFSHFVSLGSVMDIDFADMIDYLGSISAVESIVMYMENITNLRNFMSAARSVSRVKPIIALKAGRSTAGARAAAVHTGASAVEDAVYDAAFRRAGILRINDLEELLDCSQFLATLGRPSGPGLTIITNAGGPGVMAVDALASHGMEPAVLSNATIRKLNAVLSRSWGRENPVDIPMETAPETYLKIIKICAEADETDALLLICATTGMMDTLKLSSTLAAYLKKLSCPVFTSWIGGDNVEDARNEFKQAGIVTYSSAERAVRAFKNLYHYNRNIESLLEIPVRSDKKITPHHSRAESIIRFALTEGDNRLSDDQAKELLSSYGIVIDTTLMADSEKMSAQSILNRIPCELMIGSKTDPHFGPVILFGIGGILTDAFKDMSMGLPPLNRLLARQMIEETQISKVLMASEEFHEDGLPALEEMLVRTGRLVMDFPEITTVDINPIQVFNDRVQAVSAKIFISPPRVSSPMHLVISAYPRHYEKKEYTITGQDFFIRPIRPSDANLLIDHFYSLSPRSVYMRFFSPLKELSQTMLIKLTQIDYDREIALVALMGKEPNEKIVGVCRIIIEPDKTQGEFAMAISDEWHGKGIGSSLLKQCLKAAQSKGIKRVTGVALAENTQMLMLGSKLGFSVNKLPDGPEYELVIDYNKMNIE